MVPPLLLALSAARYAGGWVGLLETHQAMGFSATFAFTDANWFASIVRAPATLTLIGGYMIRVYQACRKICSFLDGRLHSVRGRYPAHIGVFSRNQPPHTLGCIAWIEPVRTRLFIAQRLLADKAKTVPDPAPMSDRQRLLWATLFVATAAIYGVILFNQVGLIPVLIIVASMLGSLSAGGSQRLGCPRPPRGLSPFSSCC